MGFRRKPDGPVWTPVALDRLRWACLGGPSIDRADAMFRLAKDLNVTNAALQTRASAMGLFSKRMADPPARRA